MFFDSKLKKYKIETYKSFSQLVLQNFEEHLFHRHKGFFQKIYGQQLQYVILEIKRMFLGGECF